MSENPAMTFPIQKIINIDERAELYIQEGGPNFMAKLKKVKCWCQDQQHEGLKSHNSRLF